MKEGEEVTQGQEIAVLESMKMEFPIASAYNGKIQKIFIRSSEQVNAGQLLAAVKKEAV